MTKDHIVMESIPITQDFPSIQFIKKTFSSILFTFNDKESMKLSLTNNFNRDLFVLIVRTCAASYDEGKGSNPECEQI